MIIYIYTCVFKSILKLYPKISDYIYPQVVPVKCTWKWQFCLAGGFRCLISIPADDKGKSSPTNIYEYLACDSDHFGVSLLKSLSIPVSVLSPGPQTRIPRCTGDRMEKPWALQAKWWETSRLRFQCSNEICLFLSSRVLATQNHAEQWKFWKY